MFIHQTLNSIGEQTYNTYLYRNPVYPAHLHKGYEFVLVLEGELSAIIDGWRKTVKTNQGLFLFPYQIHSYEPGKDSLTLITVFPETYIPFFASVSNAKKALSSLFTPSAHVTDFLLSVFKPNLNQTESVALLPTPDILDLKAVLYAICADFSKQTEFVADSKNENALLLQCLLYIEENYPSDISLTSMSEALGYNREYISRIFNKGLNLHFKDMLNQYRCEKAQQMIIETKENMATIAMECGFQSIRTFNRVFKKTTKQLPTSLRDNRQ